MIELQQSRKYSVDDAVTDYSSGTDQVTQIKHTTEDWRVYVRN